jgi:hypothetical protein
MDDFVSKLVTDPSDPPDALLLRGFLGESSEEGCIRLYFEPELRTYVEIPTGDILHSQPIPPEQSPLGGSYVWIKRDTEVVYGKPTPRRPKARADFFRGAIMQQFSGAAREGMEAEGARLRLRVQSQLVGCRSEVDACPSVWQGVDCPPAIPEIPEIFKTRLRVLCRTQWPREWGCWDFTTLTDPECLPRTLNWRECQRSWVDDCPSALACP